MNSPEIHNLADELCPSRYADALRDAEIRLKLRLAGCGRPSVADRLAVWMGDRLIVTGRRLKARHQAAADGLSGIAAWQATHQVV